MFINPKRRAAFTLIELMVASAVSLVTATAIMLLSYFSSRSFVTMTNYTDMGQLSQLALDKMAKEIRQTRQLTSFSTNSLSFLDANNNALQFTYDPDARQLVRVSGGLTNTYLTECDFLTFSIYQHTPISNTFDCYDPAYVTNGRLVQVVWGCSRQVFGTKATTESVQSAKIALRNH